MCDLLLGVERDVQVELLLNHGVQVFNLGIVLFRPRLFLGEALTKIGRRCALTLFDSVHSIRIN
jgi:hypothetical protein